MVNEGSHLTNIKISIWSLEHIHAQNAESLKKNKDILTWLESHIALLKSSEGSIFEVNNELIEKMEILIEQLHSDKDPGMCVNALMRFRRK